MSVFITIPVGQIQQNADHHLCHQIEPNAQHIHPPY